MDTRKVLNKKVVNSLGFGVFEDCKAPIKSSKDKFQCHKCGYCTDKSHNLKLHLEKYHAQIKEMQITVAEKTSSLEAEAFKTKRLQVRFVHT